MPLLRLAIRSAMRVTYICRGKVEMTNAKVWVYLDPRIYLDHRTVMGKQVPDDLLDQLA